MQNCSGSCPSMCKNGGGKYQDALSGQYEIDKTMSISCYYGNNEIKKNKIKIESKVLLIRSDLQMICN